MKLFRLSLFLFMLVFSTSLSAQPLVVEKVEPPNWWTGMKWNHVQLMLSGQNLGGITADVDEPGIRITAVHTVPNHSYAFVDLHIPAELPGGMYTINITNGENTVSIPYSIMEREISEDRHQGFDASDVVYLITPDRFANSETSNDRVDGMLDEYDPSQHGMRHGGDLRGLIDHLDYLADLGITTIWLNPVLENNGIESYHGYKTTDYYRIDPRFGTNEDYKRFTEEAHRRGIKIIFDHVNNHIGFRHPWVNNLPTTDWINGSVDEHLTDKHYKLAATDPHADPASEDQLRSFWFVDLMPDLNQRNPFLANYLIQNTIWWIEYTGLDGIREDTYPYPDQEFLTEWAKAVLEEYPTSNIVGEIWDSEPAYIAMFQDGSQLPGAIDTHLPVVMDFPLNDAYRAYLRGVGSLEGIYKVVAQDFLYANPQNLFTFFDNHDMPRGIFEAGGDSQKVKQVLAMLLTMRGIPMMLYGTEINMMGGASHIELRADFPGGFPGHTRNAFTEAGRTTEENAIFNYVRMLLHLRKAHPVLAHGKMIHYPPVWNNNVYKYLRMDEQESILVIVNGHAETREVDLADPLRILSGNRRFLNLLTDEVITIDPEQKLSVNGIATMILLSLD